MKKTIVSVILLILLKAIPLCAEPKIHAEMKKVNQNKLFVTFAWRVVIEADSPHQGCDLKITFQETDKKEIYRISEIITLNLGTNVFEGLEICDVADWNRIQNTIVILDCEF